MVGGEPRYLGPVDFYSRNDLGMTYTDYLQRREFARVHEYHISEQTKELIAAGDEVLGAQIRQLERIEAAQAEAAYTVVLSVEKLQEATERGFARVGSILDWGFSELIVRQTQTNDLLSEIGRTLSTPSQTWASEQFERARGEYRRGLFEEALESVDRAIFGHASNVGIKTEHRFRFLRGILKLGDDRNNSLAVVDLAAAESEFLLAARYAKGVDITDTATALLCAGRAANLAGNWESAAEHLREGLKCANYAALHYELAKSLCRLGETSAAGDSLRNAIRLDVNLLLIAPGDGNFADPPDFVFSNLTYLLNEARDIVAAADAFLSAEVARASSVEYSSLVTRKVYAMASACGIRLRLVEACTHELRKAKKKGGILELRKALELLPDAHEELSRCNSDLQSMIGDSLDAESEARQARAQDVSRVGDERRRRSGTILSGVPYVVAVAAIIFYLTVSLEQCQRGEVERGFFTVVFSPVVAALFGAIAAGVVAVVNKAADVSWRTSRDAAVKDGAQFDAAAEREWNEIEGRVFYKPSTEPEAVVPRWALTRANNRS